MNSLAHEIQNDFSLEEVVKRLASHSVKSSPREVELILANYFRFERNELQKCHRRQLVNWYHNGRNVFISKLQSLEQRLEILGIIILRDDLYRTCNCCLDQLILLSDTQLAEKFGATNQQPKKIIYDPHSHNERCECE